MDPADPQRAEQLSASIAKLERDQVETAQAVASLRVQLDAARGAPSRRLPATVALVAGVVISAAAFAVFASHWHLLPEWMRRRSFWKLVLLGGLGVWQLVLPLLLGALVALGRDLRGRWLTLRGWAGAVMGLILVFAFFPLAFFGADAWISALVQFPAELCFVAAWRLAPGGLAPFVTLAKNALPPGPHRQRGETLLWISASLVTVALALFGVGAAATDPSLQFTLRHHSWEVVGVVGAGLLFAALFWIPALLLRMKHPNAPHIAGVYGVFAVLLLIALVPATAMAVLLSAMAFGRTPLAALVGLSTVLGSAAVICQLVGGVWAWRTRLRSEG